MDTDFHDLFKILEKDEQVPSSKMIRPLLMSVYHCTFSSIALSSHQSLSFDQPNTTTTANTQRMPLPHQNSAQSESVMFGVPVNHHTGGLKSNSIDLMSSLDGEPKLNNTGSGANFNEFGTLNLDSALLGSSPHLQGYFPESQNTNSAANSHQSPFDYLQSQSGLVDDISYKPSSSEFGSGLDVHQQLMDGGQFSGMNGGGVGLFGSSDSTFLDMNLAS